MAFSHTVGGTTFTQANFEGNAYSDESTGFPKAMEKMVEHVANAYRGTSTTSNAVGTGSKTWTVTNSNSQIPAFAVGMPVRVARTSAPTTTYMQGEITAFTASTGSTTVNVSSSLGSGTHTDWTITIGGHQTTASASPLGVAAGGTGSGTAAAARTALGIPDSESAIAGVLETNATFVDQCLLGPAIDGRPWNGLWNKASVFSSLMCATLEDEGSNAEVNVWDLSEHSSGAISTTPLATIDLGSTTTPTAIAACMGYLIVSGTDGINFIDPHGPSGTWAVRTTGWPRRLSTGTTPALTNNDVGGVAAGLGKQPPYDPRTGGGLPTFAAAMNAGTDAVNIIHTNGVVYDWNGTVATAGGRVTISDGRAWFTSDTGTANSVYTSPYFELMTADDWAGTWILRPAGQSQGFATTTSVSYSNGLGAAGGASGLTLFRPNTIEDGGTAVSATSMINRTYNTGYLVGDIRGAWLANSNTADRSYKANTLTNNGTVPTGATESGAELQFYGPFSTSNYLSRASDADWDVLGTGAVYMSCWVKSSSCAASEAIMGFSNSAGSIRCTMTWATTSGDFIWELQGATTTASMQSDTTGYDDDAWHKVDLVQHSSTERYMYVDAVLVKTATTDCGSLSSSGNLPFAIGRLGGSSGQGATTTKAALARLSATAPSATQVRQAYLGERGMFVASAECLLQSSSTDGVLDVDVDPLTNKVLVTQTDAITVFSGLTVDSKPTVNSGSSEKGKLWGSGRVEINSANCYATMPSTDQRQINEVVRGLAAGLPTQVDLSKAKAWICWEVGYSGNPIVSSYNIKSTTLGSGVYTITFGIPFKATGNTSNSGIAYAALATIDLGTTLGYTVNVDGSNSDRTQCRILVANTSNAAAGANTLFAAFFGELENE